MGKISLEDRKKLLKEVIWPSHEPLMFERRRGRGNTNVEELYEKAHSEENIRKIAATGVRLLGNVHFYKGFGFDTEKQEMQNTKKLADLCHKYGMKCSVYVGGTMFVETLFLEEPEAKDWVQVDQDGKPITYTNHQTYRYLPCHNNDGYVKYMKRLLKYAVEEIEADRIFFDNAGIGRPEPQSCHCPECVEKFRQFMRSKYDEATLRKRLGFTTLDCVVPPTYDVFNQPWTMSAIDDPLRQEWIDFRCQSKADFYRRLNEYIKSLNPSVVVGLNIKGIYGRNRAFMEAIDHPRFVHACDYISMDGRHEAGLTESGALVSEIRSFKVARSLGLAVESPPYRLEKIEWAVAMAFNRPVKVGQFGYAGETLLQRSHHPPDLLEYYDFFMGNEDFYVETEDVADVAVLRSFASMAYNNFETHLSTILLEQTLIQSKIPFNIVLDRNLEDLSGFPVLALANQESLSDAQLTQIRDFVKQGGGLVATESTSLYDEWRRRRPGYGLADVFGFERPSEARKVMNQFGDGRIVYIPKIEPSRLVRPAPAGSADLNTETPERTAYPRIQPDRWTVPENSAEIVEAIRWANRRGSSMDIYTPETVVAELLVKKDKHHMMLHLVNFDNSSVKDIGVDLRVPYGRSAETVRVLSPDFGKDELVEHAVAGDRIFFKVPRLHVYDLVLVQLR